MKKIVLLLLLCTGITKAQNVNIPDTNFKNALLSADITNEIAYSNGVAVKIDTNEDGEIQEQEAQAIDSLDVSPDIFFVPFDIADLTGIQSFTNLKVLNCGGNLLTSLDVSSLTLLEKLLASQNQINSLNISGLTALTEIDLFNNEVSSINLTGFVNLINLNFGGNNLTAIDLTGLVNLKKVNLEGNQLSAINVTNATSLEELRVNSNILTSLDLSSSNNLKYLDCGQNSIPSIDFSNLSGLEYLYYGGNGLTSLNVSNLVNLQSLICESNNLTSLDISALTNLSVLNCSFNNISNLDLSATSSLYTLECRSNQIASLDFSNQLGLHSLQVSNNLLTSLNVTNNTNLFELFCEGNLFTTLDLNNNTTLFYVDMSTNNNLETLFYNNGLLVPPSVPAYIGIANCPNLRYVCVNEEGILYMQSQVDSTSGATNVVVNSYCIFSPTGNFNTISGTIKFDNNADGCDASDEVLPNLRVNINDGTNQGATFINSTGVYQFVTQEGDFTITPSIQNPEWFNFDPATAVINFADDNNNTTVQDFCLTANGIRPDVSIVVAPFLYARPGFDASYFLVFTNNGNQTLSGSVSLSFNDDLMNFSGGTLAPDTSGFGLLGWNYVNLQPFESRSIGLAFTVNNTTDTPPANIGDQLGFTATILPIVGDETPTDNEFQFTQTIVDAEIVNDIYCLEGDVVDPSYIGEYLHYMINFENVGTLSAQNIVIRFDVDPANFDINTLQLLNATNTVETRIIGNVVEFIFQNINLEIGGHGSILLKLRTNESLVPSDIVSNEANIFFDFNAPLNTGVANTTFQSLSSVGFENNELFSLYPNPTSSKVNITSTEKVEVVQLLDMQGRVLQIQAANEKQATIDLTGKAKGIYFLKVSTEKGTAIEKIVKE
ncbi:MAG: T9SS type A sorting domain-containing protein [Flavobacterium sp.]|nr:T9SS type A sorting domain-containing protein [Flavobacterium sp.]